MVYQFDNRYNNYRWLSGISPVWKRYGCVWFRYDQSVPNALYVTVYASKRQAEKGKQMFSFSYLPEDSDETYNIVNDSDKFMLKLEK